MVNRRIRNNLAAISAAAVLMAGCSNTTSGKTSDSPAPDAASTSVGTPAPSGAAGTNGSQGQTPNGTAGTASKATCTYVSTGVAARKVSLPPVHPITASKLTLAMNVNGTAAGSITIRLADASAPCTVGSIAHLAQAKFYDATRCHRLTTSGIYVLQCGDPTATGTGGPGYSFPDELSGSETYPAGTVAMANNGPDTNGSQFFLVYKDSQLGPNYTVFGTITGGMTVLDSIAAAGTAAPAGDGTPKKPVVISTATAS